MHAWHDDRRVERDRYAGLLAAGVTDAVTLEPHAPVPARRVEVARSTQVALSVWLAAPGAAAASASGVGAALPVLPTAMRTADVRAAGVLAPAVAGPGSDVLAPAELGQRRSWSRCPMRRRRRRPLRQGRRRIGLVCAQQSCKRPGRARRRLSRSRGSILYYSNSFFELFLRTTAKPADWVAGTGPTKEQTHLKILPYLQHS